MKRPSLLKKLPELNARMFYIAAAALIALRLLLTSQQKLYLCPEVSMLDDMLMYKLARSVAEGGWLGAYNYLTLGKRALYAVWLALLNKAGISVLFAGQLLAVSAAAAAARALRPVTQNRFIRLLVLAFLLFSPNAYADFTLRVYRANISSSFALLFFAGAAGFMLRAREGKPSKLFCWGALAGLSFAAEWLLREEAAWLLPMAALAVIISAVLIVKKTSGGTVTQTGARCAALAVSVALALAGIGAYASVNYAHYGRFVTSDLTSAEFADAYGAMTRIVVPESDKNPIVPLPRSSREKLAEASPLFAELMPYLESDDFLRWQKDCGDGIEYSGGGIYWAVRNAASLAGYYETPQKAEEYFRALAHEINAAADAGLLGEVLPRRSGLNSPITADYIAPTLKMSLESLARVASYGELRCDPESSIGSDLVLDEMEAFLHCEAQRVSYSEPESDSAARLVFWAVSERAPVGATLYNAAGEGLRCQTIASTAGDVYLDYLLEGEDMRYTSGARLTVNYELAPGEAAELALTDGETSTTVPISPDSRYPSEIITEGTITYRIEYAGAAQQSTTEYGFAELWLYRLMRVIVWVYRALGVVMFVAGTLALALAVIAFIKKKSLFGSGTVLAVCLGCLFSAALRIGMMSFADVSAFGLGVYTMYLADVYPLMALWEIAAIALWLRSGRLHKGNA